MFALIQILIVLCPFIPLLYFIKKVWKLHTLLNKEKIIREKQMQFKCVGDFSPKAIRSQLESDSKIKKNFIDKIIQAYKKLLFSISTYIIFWIVYLVWILLRINRLFNNYYNVLDPKDYGCVIASIIMSILIFYLLFLMPIFEFFQLQKLCNLGYTTWKYLQDIVDKIIVWSKQILKTILAFTTSFFLLIGIYIFLFETISNYVQIEITFWSALAMFMLYQYVVLRILSLGLKNIILFGIKFKKIEWLLDYAKNDILYLTLKNSTYLSMVFIYAVALDTDKSETPIAMAIGVLFLIDTFLAQQKTIQEKINSDNTI